MEQQQTIKGHVLIAEDDQFYANVYKIKLGKEGYKVTVAENGQVALDVARADRPQVIFLDLMMPVKDGFTTLQEIRSDEQLKDIPVIVMSNSSREDHMQQARAAGATEVIVKSNVSVEEMVAKVDSYVQPQHQDQNQHQQTQTSGVDTPQSTPQTAQSSDQEAVAAMQQPVAETPTTAADGKTAHVDTNQQAPEQPIQPVSGSAQASDAAASTTQPAVMPTSTASPVMGQIPTAPASPEHVDQPLQTQDSQVAAQTSDTSQQSSVPDASKPYIIVAEDDQFYGNVYQTKLAKEGFDVTLCKNGQKAIEAIKQRKPHLMLLDLMMPVMDGFDTLQQIQGDESLQGFKVIVLSNLGQQEDIDRAKSMGATDFLVKSNLSIQQIVAKIKEYTTAT